MDTDFKSKINRLLHRWPKNTVAVDLWLEQQGISNDLKHAYLRSKWLEPLERGAAIQYGSKVDWRGGLFALQEQLSLPIHAGGKTALEELGLGHFVRYQETMVWLFAAQRTHLPSWFRLHSWGPEIVVVRSDFLPPEIGLARKEAGEFSFALSSPERAVLEVLYLIPDRQRFDEALLLFEGLTTLRPKLLQKLLVSCTSIKVKRLFLFMADKQQHSWFKRLDLSQINLGRGKRSIIKGGRLDQKYGITVPPGLGD